MPVIKDLKNTIGSCHTSVTRIFAKFNVDHTTLSKYSAPPPRVFTGTKIRRFWTTIMNAASS